MEDLHNVNSRAWRRYLTGKERTCSFEKGPRVFHKQLQHLPQRLPDLWPHVQIGLHAKTFDLASRRCQFHNANDARVELSTANRTTLDNHLPNLRQNRKLVGKQRVVHERRNLSVRSQRLFDFPHLTGVCVRPPLHLSPQPCRVSPSC